MKILEIANMAILIKFKSIKNLYLKILPPDGQIHISAPHHTPINKIEQFIHYKLDWIKKTQAKTKLVQVPNKLYIFGQLFQLQIINNRQHAIFMQDNQIIVHTPPQLLKQSQDQLLNKFYQQLLFKQTQNLINKWSNILGVKVNKLSIRKMKTRWGSCTPATRNIRINLKLIHLNEKYLEYIVIHELVHLLEPSHNHRFKQIMSDCLPHWRQLQQELNQFHVA